MKLKTRGKLLMLIISFIVVFGIIVNLVIYFQFNKLITQSLLTTYSKQSVQSIDEKYPGDWKIEKDQLFKGNTLINDNFAIVDNIKKNTEAECTIFLGDTRVSTTIMKDGSRAVGTKADEKVSKQVIQEGSEYLGSANVVNVPFKTIYIPIKDKNSSNIGMFFVGIEKQYIDKQVDSIILIIAMITLLLVVIISILIMLLTSKIIINPIFYIKDHLEILATGDFSVDVEQKYLKKSDEFGEIAKSIKTMQDSTKDMIKAIKNSSQNIDSQSNNLASVSEEMCSATENVSSAIQDVARSTGRQAEDLVDITAVINNFGIEIENIVKAINEVEIKSMGINSLANESNSSMESLMTSVNKVGNSFKEFADKITALGENIIKINGITSLINSIADQTNLLALNAAIEAARAGEAGRGFSVVADEIRKLAEQSKESSENINKLISGISSDTNVIVGSTDMMSLELGTQVTVINTAIESFKRITSAVDEVIPKIEAVNNSAVSIEGEKDEILAKVEGASAVAEEVSASSEEITASSEEMNASSEEVAATAQNLSAMTKEMMKQVDKFKV
jgi:methyl-accepting chemotaxis protein